MNAEMEHACVTLLRDAEYLACAPAHLIREQSDLIEQARDRLNEALSKAARKLAA